MHEQPIDHSILADFATLLTYPKSISILRESLDRILQVEIDTVTTELSSLSELLNDSSTNRSQLEESYTANFDMNPKYHMYMAAHLYGETYKRSNFMIKLKEEFRKDDFEYDTSELPDYLPVLLNYMAICPDDVRDYLLSTMIIPVLEKIVLDKPIAIKIPLQSELRSMDQDLKEFEPVKKSNHYVDVLSGLLYYIRTTYGGNF